MEPDLHYQNSKLDGMETGMITFSKKMAGSLMLFAIGGVCGYMYNYMEMKESGANADVVLICHKDPGAPARTMLIPSSALQGHLGHGDYMGSCNENGTLSEQTP